MKRIVETVGAPAAIGPYSQGVEAGGLVFVSGQIPVDPVTGTMPEGVGEQTGRCLENVKAVVEAAGMTMDDVVKTTVLLTDMADFGEMNGVYGTYFGKGAPARACFQVVALPKGAKVEIEAVAAR